MTICEHVVEVQARFDDQSCRRQTLGYERRCEGLSGLELLLTMLDVAYFPPNMPE